MRSFVVDRRDNENDFEYAMRLLCGKVEGEYPDLDWTEIIELLDLDIHRDTLRKAFTGKFGGYAVYKYLTENKMQDPDLEELIKQKISLQDQRREYMKYVRKQARIENIVNELKKQVSSYPTINHFRVQNRTNTPFAEACLLISDLHIGLKTDNFWNVFNYDVAQNRLNMLLNKVFEYIKLHNIQKLNVEFLGDIIHGYIHFGTRIESEEDTVSQVIFASELLSEFVYRLAETGVLINIYVANGNHGRTTANKNDALESENFERLIWHYMTLKLANVPNVNFNIYNVDETFGMFQLENGKKIVFSHGHYDSLVNAIRNYEKIMQEHIHEVHLGHFHNFNEKTDGYSSVVVNGSLSGVDEYAKNKRLCSEPTQTLRIYVGNDVCTYKINLN